MAGRSRLSADVYLAPEIQRGRSSSPCCRAQTIPPSLPVSVGLRDFQIIKELGKGAFGEVNLSLYTKNGQMYALKKVSLNHNFDYVKSEVEIMSMCNHKNIVKMFTIFKSWPSSLCIVMEFCEGGDLSSRLAAQKGLYFQELKIMEWFLQIASAISYLHRTQIIHRDLKPANILMKNESLLKISDFGISRVLEGNKPAETYCGTRFYISPEIQAGETYSYETDIWSLGCVLVEIASLEECFTNMNNYRKGKYACIPSGYTLIPRLIDGCVKLNPRERTPPSRLLQLTETFIRNKS